MRKILFILALLLAGPAFAADGPLATAIRSLPDARAIKRFRVTESAKVGDLGSWSYTDSSKNDWIIEMMRAPTAKGDYLEVYARIFEDGVFFNTPKGLGRERVEWERLRLFGPPIAVVDDKGVLTEDPAAALKEEIGRTLALIVTDSPPRPDARGNTTDVYRPDANPESTTVDCLVLRGVTSEGFATIRAGAGTAASDTQTSSIVRVSASTTSNEFSEIRRLIWLFNTPIPTSHAISSAVLTITASASPTSALGDSSVDIVSSAPASNTACVNADFSTLGSTSFGSVASLAGTATNVAENVTLTTTAVTKNGITKLGARIGWDRAGTFGGVWASSATTSAAFYMAEQSGTTRDPALTVSHSSAGGVFLFDGGPL